MESLNQIAIARTQGRRMLQENFARKEAIRRVRAVPRDYDCEKEDDNEGTASRKFFLKENEGEDKLWLGSIPIFGFWGSLVRLNSMGNL
jgi:hypothetical protein